MTVTFQACICVLHTRVCIHICVPRSLSGFIFVCIPSMYIVCALCMRRFGTRLFLFESFCANAMPSEHAHASHQPCTLLRGWRRRVRVCVCALTDCESVCAWETLPLAACGWVCTSACECVCVHVCSACVCECTRDLFLYLCSVGCISFCICMNATLWHKGTIKRGNPIPP